MSALTVFIAVYAVVLFPIVAPPVLMGLDRIVRVLRRPARVTAPQHAVLAPQAS